MLFDILDIKFSLFLGLKLGRKLRMVEIVLFLIMCEMMPIPHTKMYKQSTKQIQPDRKYKHKLLISVETIRPNYLYYLCNNFDST